MSVDLDTETAHSPQAPAPGAPESRTAGDTAAQIPRPPRRAVVAFRAFRQSLRRSPGLIVALLVFVVVLLWAFVPQLFTSYDPTEISSGALFQPPSGEHLFGTDQLGRDQFSRVVHGTSLSLLGTLVAVLVGITLGSVIGLLAGFFKGTTDAVAMRVVDVLMSIPSFLLSLVIITAIGFGIVNVAIAVGLASSASFARIMRAEVVKIAGTTYVQAGTVYGGSRWNSLFRHILPNAISPVLSLAALEFGTAILAVSALSFLGFGATPPTPEWGSMVAEGRSYLASAWWLTTFPGLALVSVVVAANHISKALQRGSR